MSRIRIESVAEPLASQPETTRAALQLLTVAEVMGVLPGEADETFTVLSIPLLSGVVRQLAGAGIARRSHLATLGDVTDWRTLLAEIAEEVEGSPVPDREWVGMLAVLGDELLAGLLGLSRTSVRRYAAAARTTPSAVANRLHFLALLVAELAGGYNDYGIRRWFARPRTALDGRAPAELLGAGFDVDGPDARALLGLARGLTAAGAT